MRKVSKEIAQAFIDGRKLTIANTMTDGNSVYLHGNAIAKHENGKVYVSLAGWPTVTTRERVNTLLNYLGSDIGVVQRKHKTEWVNLPIGTPQPKDDNAWIEVA